MAVHPVLPLAIGLMHPPRHRAIISRVEIDDGAVDIVEGGQRLLHAREIQILQECLRRLRRTSGKQRRHRGDARTREELPPIIHA